MAFIVLTLWEQVLVLYEYLITVDRELQAVWQRRWTATSLLLLSTRWVMVVNAIVELFPVASLNVSHPTCR